MKKALLAALLAALMLVCTGCASFLERDYSVVQPHSSTYYESEDRSVLRAESYQDPAAPGRAPSGSMPGRSLWTPPPRRSGPARRCSRRRP